MSDSIQGVFDFESGEMDGYVNWRREQEQRLQAMCTEWGLPFRKRVRIRLKNIEGEFEGELRIVKQPVTIDRRVPLHLSVDNIDVYPPDIEQCVVIE